MTVYQDEKMFSTNIAIFPIEKMLLPNIKAIIDKCSFGEQHTLLYML